MLVSAFVGICALAAYPIPARRGTVSISQADGSELSVVINGDEHSCYYQTEDGYILLDGADGFFRYARLEGNAVVASNVVAHNKAVRTAEETAFLRSLDAESIRTKASSNATLMRAKAPARASENITSYPTTGSPKALIILVEYQDTKFQTQNVQQEFNNLINQKGYSHNGATGSAYDYFVDNSNGLFTPEFKVYGPVTLPYNMSYYGSSNGMIPDSQPWLMVVDGCKILDETTDIDFSEFDNDGDGFVDNVFVFYAGYGQNDGGPTDAVWPHAANIWTYYAINLTLDGVQIGNYACTNELQGGQGFVRTGIGTFCHEFSHILGLPDIYATDGSSCFTPGSYEVMDQGSYNNDGNTPPNMSIYDRTTLRWMNPRELTGPESVSLRDITTRDGFIIKTDKEEEYYLFENRQQTGWDSYIPGHGMLVWHIDYNAGLWQNNKVNVTSNHQHIDIVEADNIRTESTRDGDPFPGRSNVTSFTDDSTPAMSTWTGMTIGKPITDIHEADGIITFKVMGGGEQVDPAVALPATDITATSFVANWEKRVDIYKYEVALCRKGEVVPDRTVQVQDRTSVKFEELTPSTDYYYLVYAIDGQLKAVESNAVEVRTADPTFDMLAPSVLAATDVTENSFVANWSPMEGAESYTLNVYTKQTVDPEEQVVDFTGGITSLPRDWSTTSTMTASLAGYYGAERPSLRMASNGEMLTSPIYEDEVTDFSFWYRGNKTASENALDIEVYRDGKWEAFTSISPLSNDEGQTVAFGGDSEPELPSGCYGIRFIYRSTDGKFLYIDDVTVHYGGTHIPIYVDGYEGKDMGKATSETIDGLQKDIVYYYTVQAHNSTLSSLVSNEMAVTTTNQSAVEAIGAATNSLVVARNGLALQITCRDAARPVVVVDIAGRVLFAGILPQGTTEIPVAAHGVYIVKSETNIYKILL